MGPLICELEVKKCRCTIEMSDGVPEEGLIWCAGRG